MHSSPELQCNGNLINRATSTIINSSKPDMHNSFVQGPGEKTIEAKSQCHDADLHLFSSWFCPYAQRVWIALEELDVDYAWRDINPYLQAPDGSDTKNPKPLSQKQEEYPDFMKASPKGLVPAIQHEVKGSSGISVNRVYDSMAVLNYLDVSFSPQSQESNETFLMPSSPELRTKCHLAFDCIDKRILPLFYRLLMRQDEKSREDARQGIIRGLLEFSALMEDVSDKKGNFFLGSQFSMVDIALAPWFPQRFKTIGMTYRNLRIPSDGEFERLERWRLAVKGRPSVHNTVVDKERLIMNYIGYADNSATSAVGLAFRDPGSKIAPPRSNSSRPSQDSTSNDSSEL